MANINYSAPFSKGWNKMGKMLFHPFDIGKWFVLGFTAFLANLLNGHGGNGNIGNKWDDYHHHVDWGAVADFPATAWQWLLDHIWWFSLIIFGVLVITTIVIVLNWLSSRGKFMFLDNVVHNRAEVRKPWFEFNREGNSLFVWRLIYGLICIAVFLILMGLIFSMFLGVYAAGFPKAATIQSIIGGIFIFIIYIIITGYIGLFLTDFVVPIMYKQRVSATKAWRVFLNLLGKHFWYFLVYGLFIFLLIIVVVIAVVAFTLLTCCIGGLLLIIPYIGSVLLLPVSVTFRAFSVAFLEQFGPDFELFPKEEAAG